MKIRESEYQELKVSVGMGVDFNMVTIQEDRGPSATVAITLIPDIPAELVVPEGL